MIAEQEQSAINKTLLLGSKLHVDEQDLALLVELCSKIEDWDLLLERAVNCHVSPIMAQTFSADIFKTIVPTRVQTVLVETQNQVMARTIGLQHVFAEFARSLNPEDIPIIPLKGIYLSEVVYKDLRLRHLSDIDVLIQEKDLDRICELMEAKGWNVKETLRHSGISEKNFAHAHPRTLVKNGINIELHTHLYNGGQGAVISREELWQNSTGMDFLGLRIRQFGPEMLLQYLCLHLHKHLFGHEAKMLGFCDIREFLETHPSFDWSVFATVCERYQCTEEVGQILFLCKEYWHVPIPPGLALPTSSDKNLKALFWKFFTGHAKEKKFVFENRLGHRLENIGKLTTRKERVVFIWGHVFPTANFMRQRYRLNKNAWLFPWYVYRPFELTAKTCVVLFNRTVSRSNRA